MRLRLLYAVLGAVTVLAPVVAALPAQAAPQLGSLAVSPRTGFDTSSVTLMTTGPCPSGSNVIARVYGHGFPSTGKVVVGNTATSAYPRTAGGGYQLPLADTMQGFIDDQPGHESLAGTYRFVVTCRHRIKLQTYGDFSGTLTFTSPRAYTSSVSAAVAAAAAPAGVDSVPVPAVSPSGAAPSGPSGAAPSGGSWAAAPSAVITPDIPSVGQLQPGANVPGGRPATAAAAHHVSTAQGWLIGLGAAALLLALGVFARSRSQGGRGAVAADPDDDLTDDPDDPDDPDDHRSTDETAATPLETTGDRS